MSIIDADRLVQDDARPDDPARGQGLAARLVLDVVQHIHQRGARAMLHAARNTGAIRLYENLGFELRRRMVFSSLRTPVRP
jgi:predicted GNAT family acetyltransferase